MTGKFLMLIKIVVSDIRCMLVILNKERAYFNRQKSMTKEKARLYTWPFELFERVELTASSL